MNRLALPLFAVSLSLVTACNSEKAKHSEPPIFHVSSPLRTDTSIAKSYVCQIRSKNHIDLRAQERGYIQNIYVDEGERVHTGQALFQIMPNLYRAEFQKAQAEANFAEIEYNNTAALAEKGVVSENELALAKAELDQANAEVELARTHLSFATISAPFDGLIDRLEVRLGSLVDDGELLTHLSDNSKLWVYFNVPEAEYLDYIMSAQIENWRVQLKLANGRLFSEAGIVETIEADFDNETGNIPFRATFENPQGILRHGETGNIIIHTSYEDALVIPQKATFEVLEKKYVFIVNDAGIIEAREVKIAAELPHIYILKSGLEEGEHFLLEGLRLVRPGEEIEYDVISGSEAIHSLDLYTE
ncbi:MAG: efflux RND transporter periplasmic adaptor subunit [Flavobacteriia bacterium]|nr:efflux RND transporter periplasmic adaptor subunit [Flavobacteriia bacterium]